MNSVIDINNTDGIQSGDVTHHQDQSILFVNLRTRKTTNRMKLNPNPLFVLLFILLLCIRMYKV